MYDMNWKVSIGEYRLGIIESVKIKRSVELLSDTATITLPSTVYNKSMEDLKKLKRGANVVIELGYNGDYYTEFDGYVESLNYERDSLKINCEDAIFLYREVALANIELVNNGVKQILEHVNLEVTNQYKSSDESKQGPYTLSCDYDFSYDKFVINGMNAYDVLKKIQEEAKPNIYLKEKVLHVHPMYAQTFGEKQYYDFSINIEDSDLKYEDADDRKVQVEIEYIDKDGKSQKVTLGDTGGKKVTRKNYTSDSASATLLAQEELKNRVYTGYAGSFTGWMIPYCDAGYVVNIKDSEDESKAGSYYVLAVEVNFSKSGGKRKITIGKKLSDG